MSSLSLGSPVFPHPGGLDGNDCHYDTGTGRYHRHRDAKRHRHINAVARKSRENVCHDPPSPNYRTLEYVVGYPSLQARVTSGGRAFGS